MIELLWYFTFAFGNQISYKELVKEHSIIKIMVISWSYKDLKNSITLALFTSPKGGPL